MKKRIRYAQLIQFDYLDVIALVCLSGMFFLSGFIVGVLR